MGLWSAAEPLWRTSYVLCCCHNHISDRETSEKQRRDYWFVLSFLLIVQIIFLLRFTSLHILFDLSFPPECFPVYLENPVLASLDAFTHVIFSLDIQRLLEQLFKCVHSIVHLLSKKKKKGEDAVAQVNRSMNENHISCLSILCLSSRWWYRLRRRL